MPKHEITQEQEQEYEQEQEEDEEYEDEEDDDAIFSAEQVMRMLRAASSHYEGKYKIYLEDGLRGVLLITVDEDDDGPHSIALTQLPRRDGTTYPIVRLTPCDARVLSDYLEYQRGLGDPVLAEGQELTLQIAFSDLTLTLPWEGDDVYTLQKYLFEASTKPRCYNLDPYKTPCDYCDRPSSSPESMQHPPSFSFHVNTPDTGLVLRLKSLTGLLPRSLQRRAFSYLSSLSSTEINRAGSQSFACAMRKTRVLD